MTEKIIFRNIKKSDYQFLYDLLLQRRKIVNISHKKMPTYEEHVNFVSSKPYSKWYIIEIDGKRSGSIYLTKQNEVGMHLLRKYDKKKIYLNIIRKITIEHPKNSFLMNISPKNKQYIDVAKILGFRMIQHTYELDKRAKI